jgi:hypothetical protein
MKKFIVILLIAFFAVGISSCAEDYTETDPIAPEISVTDDAPANQESGTVKRKTRKSSRSLPKAS